MAAAYSTRLYKDYSLDDGSFEVPRRKASLKRMPDSARVPTASQRTINPEKSSSDGQSSSVGLTTDDDGVTSYEEESAESDFHESRVNFPLSQTASALPAIPAEWKQQQRSRVPSRGSDSQRMSSPRNVPLPDHASITSPPQSPPPRAITRPSYQPSYRGDESQQGPMAIAPDGAGYHSATTSGQMPDFFSLAVFQVVLRNPAIAHQLLKFAQTRLCGEHMEFLAKVNNYHVLLHEVSRSISGIYEGFFQDGASKYLNIPQGVNEKVNREIKSAVASVLPKLESVFAPAQTDVERLIYGDIYPQFVRHQMSVSAAKALGSNRGKYAGLGDCFVLTDPTKADNPIVFASDGFVKVTGHPRNEIIPRNCRFLQGQQTDRASVQRIKDAIDKREECVELLLNHKKTGEPFWNLLYVTPLFSENGNLVFFLGGQINCSTTINSTSDVLRILSQSRNDEEDSRTDTIRSKPPPGPSRSIRHPFASNRASVAPRAPGMEDQLVDRLANLPLTSQFREFYTAYSNFIVINYSTMLIAFVSGGIIDLLFPIKAKTAYQTLAVGTDIFKFLSNHGTGSGVSWDFKSSVKNAMKSGQATSLELKLCAKPSMGIERFILHWTPLKDDKSKVHWIVLTLGNEQRA